MCSNKDIRQLILWAEKIGWHVERKTAKSHYMLRHDNGETTVIPGTPSDPRAVRNARADLTRKAGRGR